MCIVVLYLNIVNEVIEIVSVKGVFCNSVVVDSVVVVDGRVREFEKVCGVVVVVVVVVVVF